MILGTWRILCAGAAILLWPLSARASGTPPPAPVAPRHPHTSVWHGAKVEDPYFWLREKKDPSVLKYLRDENAYTDAVTAPIATFTETLYKEMVGRIQENDRTASVRDGAYHYYERTEAGRQYVIHCRRKSSGDFDEKAPEEVLLDENQQAKEYKYFSVGDFVVSDDAALLAYTADLTGYRQYQLFVKDLKTGAMLPDSAERVRGVVWASDNKTLYYITEDPLTKRSNILWRKVLGGEAEPIYMEQDRLFGLDVTRSKDRRYVFLRIAATDTYEVRYIQADNPTGALTVVIPREKGHKYEVEHRDGEFYIRTNKEAHDFRLVTAPVSSPRKWHELVAHRPGVLLDGVDVFKDGVVVAEKSRGLTNFQVLDLKTHQTHTVSFPESAYEATLRDTPEFGSPTFRFAYQSLTTPASIYDYDMAHRTRTLRKREEVRGGYDAEQFVTERVWAKARDGVEIPVTLAHRKGVGSGTPHPLLLIGYGAYGAPTPPVFASHRISLLERGIVLGLAHVRGGNELGERWHDDGMLMKKKNSFYDFIDVAVWLQMHKWTSKDLLLARGGSAGGLLMAAAANIRPDIFRAIHAAVPFVDVMNTMMDASLPLTVGEYLEWGNPNERPAFDYMRTYSPYDALEKKAYPAILVTTSLNDSQVGYWEPAKYVAKLRTLKTDSNQLLLKCIMEAGHGGPSGRYTRLKHFAFEAAWLIWQAGLPLK